MLRSRRFLFALVPGALVVLAAGCGAGDDASSAPVDDGAPGATVVLEARSFAPSSVVVDAGETVTWEWGPKMSHNIVGAGGINQDVKDSGTYEKRFDQPGTFDYRCTLHPGMDGTVIVR